MAWLDLTLVALLAWIAINVWIAALLVSAANRQRREPRRPVRTPEYGTLRLVSSRSGSTRTPS